MNKPLSMLLAATLAAFGAQASFAQEAGAKQDRAAKAEQAKAAIDKRFADADTNHDGKLSRDEAKTGMPKVYEHFDEMDTAKSGFVTKDQVMGEMKKMVGERRKHKG
jgi:hypothetical protein